VAVSAIAVPRAFQAAAPLVAAGIAPSTVVRLTRFPILPALTVGGAGVPLITPSVAALVDATLVRIRRPATVLPRSSLVDAALVRIRRPATVLPRSSLSRPAVAGRCPAKRPVALSRPLATIATIPAARSPTITDMAAAGSAITAEASTVPARTVAPTTAAEPAPALAIRARAAARASRPAAAVLPWRPVAALTITVASARAILPARIRAA